MYKIHVGDFPIGYPFEFERLEDAKLALVILRGLTDVISSWKDLKPLQIWCTHTERYVK